MFAQNGTTSNQSLTYEDEFDSRSKTNNMIYHPLFQFIHQMLFNCVDSRFYLFDFDYFTHLLWNFGLNVKY